MGKKRFPSLKRVLIYFAISLQRLRDCSEPQFDFLLSDFEKMVIILEDRRYLKHRGLDIKSVARETLKLATFRRHGGASTIEMQYVRTVTGKYERTLVRKFQESILAILLGFHLDKVTILRSYLDVAYFGTRITGAKEAARNMFGCELGSISLEQAAVLASLLVYPIPRNKNVGWKSRVERRSIYGLRLWRRLNQSLE